MRIMANIAILALAGNTLLSGKAAGLQTIGDGIRRSARRRASCDIDARPAGCLWNVRKGGRVPQLALGSCPKRMTWNRASLIEITSNTPEHVSPGRISLRRPYAKQLKGAHIRVFFDRIENSGTGKLVPVLLAHVLVHEITHILQGSDHHSEEGVMKAHWTANDLYQMSYRPLPFDPFDVELIRRGLANRDRATISAHLGNRGVAELAATQ